jgi:predicted aspartyl protease
MAKQGVYTMQGTSLTMMTPIRAFVLKISQLELVSIGMSLLSRLYLYIMLEG